MSKRHVSGHGSSATCVFRVVLGDKPTTANHLHVSRPLVRMLSNRSADPSISSASTASLSVPVRTNPAVEAREEFASSLIDYHAHT